jgi:hypothetical protein
VDAVALAATIGGSIVGVAGIGGSVYIARLQRKTEVKLAEDRQQHERDLARGQRLYERRAPIYEATVAFAAALMAHVEATQPIITFAGEERALPPMPSDEDQLSRQAQLHAHGSPEVANAMDELADKVRLFFIQAGVIKTILEQGGPLQNERVELQATREQVRAANRTLRELVSNELASL